MPRERVLIHSGSVVLDGVVDRTAAVLIEGDSIAGVISEGEAASVVDAVMVDASGCMVLPGLVNAHSHGGTTGPLFSSAAAPVPAAQATANLDRHLRAGVTTLVNVCGFGTFEDMSDHVIDLRLGTTHFPSALVAAEIVDGSGLRARHRAMSAREMVSDGALLLGEIGSGATLGGGVAAYRYVPETLEPVIGRRLDPQEATTLIDALVGVTRLQPPDDAALAQAFEALGLPASGLTAAREAILRFASEPVHASLDSFDEAAALSEQLGIPAVFHAAAPSVDRLLHLARTTKARIVAGHINHTSFTPQEAVRWARELRDAGAVLDVSSLDVVHARRLAQPDVADALAREGLIDTLSTDYAGGAWEPMLDLVQRWRSLGWVDLLDGIAMCTSTPAKVFGLADRGRIAEGLRADLVIVDESDLSRVRDVLVGGRVVWAPSS